MTNKLYWYWSLAELATAVLLLRGLSNWMELGGFLVSHGLVVGLTYLIFFALAGTNRILRQSVITRDFALFLLTLAVVPLIGPPAVLFLILFLCFYPLHPIRVEAFEKVNRDVLVIMQKIFEGRVIPVTEALLIRGMDRADALKMTAVIGEMEWSAAKSGILKYIIRLSPYQGVVLLAIDLMNKKMDAVLAGIAEIQALKSMDRPAYQKLAHQYHEICYLDLCDPVMKQFYQARACQNALAAFEKSGSEDDALLAVKYLLEADRIQEARKVYETVRAQGDYFFPKWISYEFELSIRLGDKTLFENLNLLIETGGGVFIPDKVKEAAKAWRMVLTSAWL